MMAISVLTEGDHQIRFHVSPVRQHGVTNLDAPSSATALAKNFREIAPTDPGRRA
jgi:hypothetical protein